MKNFIYIITTLLFSLIFMPSITRAGYDFNISVSDGDTGFSFSVSNYYRVPEREVIIIRERGIDEEELPVVYFIARRAHVSPQVIIQLRLSGMSWMDISLRYGIGADVYYVPLKEVYVVGPPYGKAYGYYKKYPRHMWKEIRLEDDDIVNLVNLRFMSEYHGVSPEEIIRMKGQNKRFVTMDKEFKEKKKKEHREKDHKKKRGRDD